MALQRTPDPGDAHTVPLRIERGAVAQAVDGPVGTIEQIVVDRTSGQMSALVIRGSDSGSEFELPVRYIEFAESTGNHVQLKLSRRDLADNPEMVKPYNPQLYTPVYQGEAMPASVAHRVATESERPVVTDIEENAAEMVVTGKDTVAGSAPAAALGAAAPASGARWTPRTDTEPGASAAAAEDTTPTVKLNAAQPSTGEAVAGDQESAPAPEASPTPATTGALMGGKPSTSGMGEKSFVPPSSAPALDTVPTSTNLPPYTTEHPDQPDEAVTASTTPNLASATDVPQAVTPGMEPTDATPLESSAQPASQADVNEISTADKGGEPADITPAPFRADAQGTPESVAPPDTALGAGEVPVQTTTVLAPHIVEPPLERGSTEPAPTSMPPTPTTPAQPQVLDQMKDRVLAMLVSLGRSPTVLLAVGGLTAGLITGLVLRQRRSARDQAQRAASHATERTKTAVDRTRDQASSAASQALDVAALLSQSAHAALQRASEKTQAMARDAQATVPASAEQPSQQAKVTAAQSREQAKDAGRQAKKRAKRAARRFRWFRRGLVAGAALGMLYAPRPGVEVRSRLANTIQGLRSRSA